MKPDSIAWSRDPAVDGASSRAATYGRLHTADNPRSAGKMTRFGILRHFKSVATTTADRPTNHSSATPARALLTVAERFIRQGLHVAIFPELLMHRPAKLLRHCFGLQVLEYPRPLRAPMSRYSQRRIRSPTELRGHLSADPALREDLKQHRVGLASINNRGLTHTTTHGVKAGPHLRDHARFQAR